MIELLARTKVTVTPPSDFPWADQLRFFTAFAFLIATVITIWVAWDCWKDYRATRGGPYTVRLTAAGVLREEVVRALSSLLLFAIATIRVFVPGPAPALSLVTSILMAIVAVLMTVNSIFVDIWRRRVLKAGDGWDGTERRKGGDANDVTRPDG